MNLMVSEGTRYLCPRRVSGALNADSTYSRRRQSRRRQITECVLRLPFLKLRRHRAAARENRAAILISPRPSDKMIPNATYMAEHIGQQQLRNGRVSA